jgi:hypothetical protein
MIASRFLVMEKWMSSIEAASNTTAPTQFLQVKAIPTGTGGSVVALSYRCFACSTLTAAAE